MNILGEDVNSAEMPDDVRRTDCETLHRAVWCMKKTTYSPKTDLYEVAVLGREDLWVEIDRQRRRDVR